MNKKFILLKHSIADIIKEATISLENTFIFLLMMVAKFVFCNMNSTESLAYEPALRDIEYYKMK